MADSRPKPKMLSDGDAEAFDDVYEAIQRRKREREEIVLPDIDEPDSLGG